MRRLLVRFSPFAVAVSAAAFAPPVSAAPLEGSAGGGFEKGSWTFQAYGGYVNDLGPYDVEMGFASVGVGYYLIDNISLSAEVSGYGISQPEGQGEEEGKGGNAVAGGAGVVFRHHVFNFNGGETSLFIDVAASLFEASERVPAEGTQWNYATQTGLGIVHGSGPGPNLLLGVRFFHLSNADMHGNDRNPALNGVSGYVGVMFKL